MTIEKGILFDLDGVITDTAKYHYDAWKKIASELGIEITIDFNEKLKGIDRASSLNRILDHGNVELSVEDFDLYMNKKNDLYISYLEQLTANDILPGIRELFIELKQHRYRISIASASKNAPFILQKIGLLEYVDFIANPENVENPKPAPDIFLEAMRGIKCNRDTCVGVEDSIAGVEAINLAGIKSISIGIKNSEANYSLKDTTELTFGKIEEILKTEN